MIHSWSIGSSLTSVIVTGTPTGTVIADGLKWEYLISIVMAVAGVPAGRPAIATAAAPVPRARATRPAPIARRALFRAIEVSPAPAGAIPSDARSAGPG